ncbi:sulfate ABC transporter substrate-binding protein [soil metagenome]
MTDRRRVVLGLAATASMASGLLRPLSASAQQAGGVTLLNVSYDVMRDFYKDLNPAFQKSWKASSGQDIVINQSHGGSTRQATSVINGLDADVVTMNQATDIDLIARAGLIPADWAKRLPNASAPFTSSIVFLVRKGNPKGIKDWADIVKPGVQIVLPNPKLSGNGRYSYLSAWGYARTQAGGSDATAKAYVAALLKNVPVLDGGGRAATTTFIQRNIGDVLLTFENEAEMIAREFGRGGFDVVYPSTSILCEMPVAVVDKVVDKKGTRKLASAYLEFLYTPEGQEIGAQNYMRTRDAKVNAKYAAQFPKVGTFNVADVFGDWDKAQKAHFDDGGSFDQVYTTK